MKSSGQFFSGALFLLHGFFLVFKPGLKRYIIVPIIMNTIVLSIIFIFLAIYLHTHIPSFLLTFPKWILIVLGGLFWVLYGLISLLVSTLIFTVLTNLIASPFYGLLAEKTAKGIQNHSLDRADNQVTFANEVTNKMTITDVENAEKIAHSYINLSNTSNIAKNTLLHTYILLIPRTLARELRKLLYFLPWLLLCLLFLIFPFAWPLLPFVWWVILSWILAVQYIDYQADNQQISLKQMIILLKKSPFKVFGFGAAVSLALLIPGANLFVPAAAVAGGTALWLSIQKKIA